MCVSLPSMHIKGGHTFYSRTFTKTIDYML